MDINVKLIIKYIRESSNCIDRPTWNDKEDKFAIPENYSISKLTTPINYHRISNI